MKAGPRTATGLLEGGERGDGFGLLITELPAGPPELNEVFLVDLRNSSNDKDVQSPLLIFRLHSGQQSPGTPLQNTKNTYN